MIDSLFENSIDIEIESVLLFEFHALPVSKFIDKELVLDHDNKKVKIKFSLIDLGICHYVTFRNSKSGVQVYLIEARLRTNINEIYLDKKIDRMGFSRAFSDLKPKERWQSIAISNVLQVECINVINKLLDKYRLNFHIYNIPPVTISHILDAYFNINFENGTYSFQRMNPSLFVYNDNKVGDTQLNRFTTLVDHGYHGSVITNLMNSINLIETGNYSSSIVHTINFFHSFMEELIAQCIDDKYLINDLRERSYKYDPKMLRTWMFALITGSDLENFIKSKQAPNTNNTLYDKYRPIVTTHVAVS